MPNRERQRALGADLARQWQAPRTLAVIQDPEACYADILKSALAEVGPEKLVQALRQGDPTWSFQALQALPALAPWRSELLAKTAERSDAALHALRFSADLGEHAAVLRNAAGPAAEPQAAIDKFEFDNNGIYIAWFAMVWVHAGQRYEVTRQSGGIGSPWPVGGGGLMKGEYDKVGCNDFARMANLPLAGGDEVWVKVQAQSGDSAESPVRCVYQPDAMQRAKYVATGTVRSVGIDYGGHWQA